MLYFFCFVRFPPFPLSESLSDACQFAFNLPLSRLKAFRGGRRTAINGAFLDNGPVESESSRYGVADEPHELSKGLWFLNKVHEVSQEDI